MREHDELGEGVTLVEVTDLPAGVWDALAVHSPRGHAFQSHAWGELKRQGGWTPRRYRIDLAGKPVAALSVQVRGASRSVPGALTRILPGPLRDLAYVYGPRGPILLENGDDAVAAALDGARGVGARAHAAVVTIDPWWVPGDGVREHLARAGFRAARRDVQVSRTAMLVPLGPDKAAQHERLSGGTANRINRAHRDGVRAEAVDLTDAAARDTALEEFYAMLEATGRRQGFVVRDRGYQIEQWRELARTGLAFLWFAVLDARRRCGTICLRCGHTLLSYNSASADDADLGRTSANHLLQWEIIRWALGAGFASYDMGGVDTQNAPGLPRDESHPLWGLMVFKRGFGAVGVEYLPAQELIPNPAVRSAWNLVRRLR